MKRILTVIAAAATLGGVTAPAAIAQDQRDADVSMLTGKVYRALRDCNIDTNVIDDLTMGQVAGIVLTDSSGDAADKCQEIEAFAMGGANQ